MNRNSSAMQSMTRNGEHSRRDASQGGKHRKKVLRAYVLGTMLLGLMATSGRAQNADSSNIRRAVMNASGAVIPGVTVDVPELKAGFDKKLTTNGVDVCDTASARLAS